MSLSCKLYGGKRFIVFAVLTVLFLLSGIGCREKNTAVIRKPFLSSWEFKADMADVWHPSRVPGTVHTDLYNDSLIPNPFYGTNEAKLQWIGKKDWWYKTKFDVPDAIFSKKHIALVFKGLDTYAEVRLNGHLLLKADNMFRTWRVQVKKYLLKKGNVLTVLFRSPLKVNLQKVKNQPYPLPADNDRSPLKVSVYTRKAPYQFGWDWGPRFVTCGIWRPVVWEAWDNARLDDFQVFQKKVSKTEAVLQARASLLSDKKETATLLLFQNDTLISKESLRLQKGENPVRLPIVIENPKLWWANGLGKPHLYRFSVKLVQNGRSVDEKSVRFGIRTLEVVQKPDSVGKSFYFKLNGVPVFLKGANYIPQDNFLPRVSKQKYERLIRDVKQAHMNMLRVWGGGIYENDEFYDLCDENGILVWQDFMFACSFYPGDSTFLNNVKAEAVENVKRLRNHPCLALWCGNNEIQVAWDRWGYQQKYHYTKVQQEEIVSNYNKLFHKLLPGVVRQYDSGRFYWPSSPNSAPQGWEQEAQTGDMHYWGVWWGRQPFGAYEKYVGRFMSEYGFQSMPAYATIARFAPDSSRYLVSPVMRAHNKHPVGYEIIRQYMKRDFRIPENFKDYILVSQLLQAKGMKTAIEAHRRARPWCMGTLFWQLDDCWPVVSWSGIDYYGRWKALQYRLQRLFAPVLVSPVYQNGKLKVFLVSDLLREKPVQIHLFLSDFYGKILWRKTKTVEMKANTSQMVFSMPFAEKIKTLGKTKLFLHVSVTEGDSTVAENNLFFAPPKALILPAPKINYALKKSAGSFVLKLSSPVFVKYVALVYPDDTGVFSDNYFSLLPGQTKEVQIHLSRADMLWRNGSIKVKALY
jgi:beta-mannosidase